MRSRRVRLAATAAVLVIGVLVAVIAGTGGSDGDGPATSATSSGSTTLVEGAVAGTVPGSGAAPGADTAAAGRSGLELVALSSLPDEAGATWALILADGPFPYDRDGVTFQNREGLLPDEPRGHYREYTVPTPGEDDRGARRLVVGGEPDEAGAGAVFYTGDHYASFVEVDTDR